MLKARNGFGEGRDHAHAVQQGLRLPNGRRVLPRRNAAAKIEKAINWKAGTEARPASRKLIAAIYAQFHPKK